MESEMNQDLWVERELEIESYFRVLQREIIETFEGVEGGDRFIRDEWQRKAGGGGGVTCVLQEGKVFEKFGIGFSRIEGTELPMSASTKRKYIAGQPYLAMGVSLVAHPYNPKVPTSHMNVRYFRTRDSITGEPVWWFGGGYDLTPYYPAIEDCVHWHQTAKKVCVKHFDESVYERFKRSCDDYFFIKHRNCRRGIGGIFFDDLNTPDFEGSFTFVKELGRSFIDAYLPIVNTRRMESFTDHQKQFQLYRRGRYVEFNLVYDRGTLFGLESGGRVESILMSMPPLVRFDYNWENEPDSVEASLEKEFLEPRDWAAVEI